MTRKLLITVILGIVVLALGVQSALANSSDLTSMIKAREKALGRTFQLGDFAVNNTWQVALSGKAVPKLRSSLQLAQVGNGPCGTETFAIVIDGKTRAKVC